MTLNSILAQTKYLIPAVDFREVRCELKTGKKVAIKIGPSMDFDKEYTRLRNIVYMTDDKLDREQETEVKSRRSGTIIRRDTDGKIFDSLSMLCEDLGILSSSSGSVLKQIKEYGIYRGEPYTILRLQSRKDRGVVRYSSEVIQQMRQAYESGKRDKEVAALIGVSVSAINKAKATYLKDFVKRRKKKVVTIESVQDWLS